MPDEFTVARMVLQRQRRMGASFEVAWGHVFEALPPTGTSYRAREERDRAVGTLHDTREWWGKL